MKASDKYQQSRLAVRAHPCALAVAAVVAGLAGQAQAAPPLSGAIFTTTEDGSIVNENVHYEDPWDVYLDGGPPPNAPPTAAGLPDGDYYFQVTDPSGKDLLSSDHISCRRIRITGGLITDYLPEYDAEGNPILSTITSGKTAVQRNGWKHPARRP